MATRSPFLKGLLFIVVLLPGLFFLRPIGSGNAKDKEPPKRTAPPDKTVSDKTRSADSSATRGNLAARIDSAIDGNELAAARWGVSVISMADGSTIYERNADKLFTPASNMKIYTTGVALDLLGADYHWRTSVYS
ncbi:MAG TPA: D-alanyl-D-alanine carboxypeptidase, partial [Pyrinomonadaceae bacterium]